MAHERLLTCQGYIPTSPSLVASFGGSNVGLLELRAQLAAARLASTSCVRGSYEPELPATPPPSPVLTSSTHVTSLFVEPTVEHVAEVGAAAESLVALRTAAHDVAPPSPRPSLKRARSASSDDDDSTGPRTPEQPTLELAVPAKRRRIVVKLAGLYAAESQPPPSSPTPAAKSAAVRTRSGREIRPSSKTIASRRRS